MNMALSKSQPVYTVDEYLSLERTSAERHEYLDGLIYAMAGESGAHADITANLVFILVGQLKGKECRARSKDTKVRSGPTPKHRQATSGLYSYPDLVVLCGEPQYHDEHADVILNPTVIVEVLSPATEAFDRGEKFRRYQMWNQTLSDYLLVSQDRPQIEHYARQAGGSWSYDRAEGLEASVAIASIGCTLRLVDVFDRIEFPES
jgi:Uma2 family endonuclease